MIAAPQVADTRDSCHTSTRACKCAPEHPRSINNLWSGINAQVHGARPSLGRQLSSFSHTSDEIITHGILMSSNGSPSSVYDMPVSKWRDGTLGDAGCGVVRSQLPRVWAFWLWARRAHTCTIGGHTVERADVRTQARMDGHGTMCSGSAGAQQQKGALPKVSRSVLATTIATAPAA